MGPGLCQVEGTEAIEAYALLQYRRNASSSSSVAAAAGSGAAAGGGGGGEAQDGAGPWSEMLPVWVPPPPLPPPPPPLPLGSPLVLAAQSQRDSAGVRMPVSLPVACESRINAGGRCRCTTTWSCWPRCRPPPRPALWSRAGAGCAHDPLRTPLSLVERRAGGPRLVLVEWGGEMTTRVPRRLTETRNDGIGGSDYD